MFHSLSRESYVRGRMLKFPGIVFLDSIQRSRRAGPELVIRFNIASDETDPQKQRRYMDIAHVHN